MPLSKQDQQRLKKPFGRLIPDEEVSEKLIRAEIVDAEMLMAVGDATTHRLFSFGITPDIAVVDGHERRSKRDLPLNHDAREIRCTNTKGTISLNAIRALKSALRTTPPTRIIVDGEEDLLALPLFLLSPRGSVVLYGQPLEGLVAVKVTDTKKKQAKKMLTELFGSSIVNAIEKQTGK